MAPSIRKLFDAAKKARLHSYSPYSNCKVGAAIRTKSGKIYGGCNVENSSYGGAICAERGAIQTAVAAEGKIQIRELLVVTDANPPWPPCGLCRQIISEFAAPDLTVHLMNLKGQQISVAFDAIMPQAFTPEHLNKE
ncbi:MAG TPA: cytidine deaminase [Bdellovibrionales bacterium]|nr:MAG: cytidine deaminase [Bdellovibrionales bacterium GWB1_52_6]OFZ05309.1 MAG: cytidine deaminase [Bdellovibrionales bacterium GWA1_52_35]OFZ42799.1 MAG: cytidine deaminase [Bdellovibrionales bacterium GWC1_52_8]HAR41130.1 cytidine deaminase [Bdellovibrionales bacterium]HCM38603.1 cytidine deaminase [Bdellovibrionales bacterium]